jgi:hypothetical protein
MQWVRLNQIRKPAKPNSIPQPGQPAEVAEVEFGHKIWYVGKLNAELKFILDSSLQIDGDSARQRVAVQFKQPLNPEIVRCSAKTTQLSYEEAKYLVSCTASPSKLFSIFPSRAEAETMPNELASLSYPDDLEQGHNSEWKRIGFDLDAFADMFSVKEAEELNTVAESFDVHYSTMVPPPAPSWPDSQPDNHRHMAHVREGPFPRELSADACPHQHTTRSSPLQSPASPPPAGPLDPERDARAAQRTERVGECPRTRPPARGEQRRPGAGAQPRVLRRLVPAIPTPGVPVPSGLIM